MTTETTKEGRYETATEDKAMPGGVIRVDEKIIQSHLDKVVLSAVEQTLNALLDAEAERLRGAGRYEHTEARKDQRAGHYERQYHTKAGGVTLRMPKLRKLPFEPKFRNPMATKRHKRSKENTMRNNFIKLHSPSG